MGGGKESSGQKGLFKQPDCRGGHPSLTQYLVFFVTYRLTSKRMLVPISKYFVLAFLPYALWSRDCLLLDLANPLRTCTRL